MLALLTYSHS